MLLLRLINGIFQGVTMPPLHPTIFYLYLLQDYRLHFMAVIVSSTSVTTYLGYFYMLAPCHPYTLENYFLVCHECEIEIEIARAHYASASTCLRYCFRVRHACPTP